MDRVTAGVKEFKRVLHSQVTASLAAYTGTLLSNCSVTAVSVCHVSQNLFTSVRTITVATSLRNFRVLNGYGVPVCHDGYAMMNQMTHHGICRVI